MTFFVYATDNRAQWYTAQVSYTNQNAQGALVFSGPMYTVTGPWFGAPFNPNAVGVRQVGTATFTAFVRSATLSYSVDGTLVSKSLTRQTFRNNNLTGQYGGVLRVQTTSGCSAGVTVLPETYAGIGITHSGSAFFMATNDGAEICNYSGNYTQDGRMGTSQGTYSCPGRSGTYQLFEIEAGFATITGRYSVSNNFCSSITGHFAIAKRL